MTDCMKKMFFLVASLAALSFTSCASVNSVRLSGALAEKSYEVSCDYSSIDVSSSIKVLYSLNTEKVTVQADSAVLGMVCVEERGKVLKIYMHGGFNKGDIGPVTVTVPASDGLERVDLGGASCFESGFAIEADSFTVDIHGASSFNADLVIAGKLCMEASGASNIGSAVSAKDLTVDASGASDVNVSGKADSYSIYVSGASTVSSKKAYVETGTLSCTVSGAGSAHVKCNGSASGNVSGASSLYLYGDAEADISTSGASSLHRRAS